MAELIKITKNSKGTNIVSARELHSFLESKEGFSKWIKRMLEYGFEQNIDYQAINFFVQHQNGIGGTHKTDFALTLDTAKEISMIQRSDNGKKARRYFISCEKELRKQYQYNLPKTYSQALIELAKTVEAKEIAEKSLKQASSIIKANKPKVIFANSVIGSENSILIRQFAKDLSDGNFTIGQNRLFKWFRNNKYLQDNNEPYQKYVDMGLFEVVKRVIGNSDNTFTSSTTKITGKGQVYFAEKIKL